MEKEKYTELIDRYYDRELTREEESFLFSMLASDAEASDYFRSAGSLKNEINSTKEEYPRHLDRMILGEILEGDRKKSLSFSNFSHYFAYAASVVLLVAGLLFYNSAQENEKQLSIAMNELKNQQEKIELLYNSLPAAEVKEEPENQVIITLKKM